MRRSTCLQPTFTIPHWSYALCRRLSESYITVGASLPSLEWKLEFRIHETQVLLFPRSDREYYTWSPCGQFVAVGGLDDVKIRDALTFELVSTLKNLDRGYSEPSYSPDGRSLACSTSTGITIWDVQTGGVAKQIQCRLPWLKPLVWSSDGSVVGFKDGKTVKMYDITSGTELPSIMLESDCNHYLWAHKKSFRVIRLVRDKDIHTIDMFELGIALTKIDSFPIDLEPEETYTIAAFSPTTYRVSFYSSTRIIVLDARTSERLLIENGSYTFHSFSSDGAYFAINGSSIRIWNYDGRFYIPWREFPSEFYSRIQFSPNSSSILVPFDNTVRIWRLDSPPLALATRSTQLNIFSRSGTHIATAHYQESTITITNLVSQSPSQIIDTGFEIKGLGLTGNVLLVKGPKVIVGWLLTDEGNVSNVSINNASLWTMSVSSQSRPKFSVKGETAVIKAGKSLHVYNSRTGEVLDSTQDLSHFSGLWYFCDDNIQALDDHSDAAQTVPPI